MIQEEVVLEAPEYNIYKIEDVLHDGIGYVELIDAMGSDLDIVNAAKVSYNKEATTFGPAEEKLLWYLWFHKHTSPFEQVELKWRIKAPAVVWWQFVRHRMAEYNATSGRYTPYKDEYYTPPTWRGQDKHNKQASSDVIIQLSPELEAQIEELMLQSEQVYQDSMKEGVSREIARLNRLAWRDYHTFIVKMNAHAFMNFLTKRDHKDAQWEIQQYAKAMKNSVLTIIPATLTCFDTYRKEAVKFEEQLNLIYKERFKDVGKSSS